VRDADNDAWQRAFLATTVALGAASVDEALLGIDDTGKRPLTPRVSALVTGLRSPHKSTRATAMAEVLRDVMVAIDEAAL